AAVAVAGRIAREHAGDPTEPAAGAALGALRRSAEALAQGGCSSVQGQGQVRARGGAGGGLPAAVGREVVCELLARARIDGTAAAALLQVSLAWPLAAPAECDPQVLAEVWCTLARTPPPPPPPTDAEEEVAHRRAEEGVEAAWKRRVLEGVLAAGSDPYPHAVSRLAHWTLGEVGAELLSGLGDAPLRGGEEEGTPPWQAVQLQLRHAAAFSSSDARLVAVHALGRLAGQEQEPARVEAYCHLAALAADPSFGVSDAARSYLAELDRHYEALEASLAAGGGGGGYE
ncbi:hypothetical protein T484DRAFT_1920972, partial [Baffinella frigidus]